MLQAEAPAVIGLVGPAVASVAPLFVETVQGHTGVAWSRTESIRTKSAIVIRACGLSPFTADGTGESDDFLFAADAHLENRAELGALLSIPSTDASALSHRGLLERLFVRFGAEGIARALGAFVFAAWDEKLQRLTLGRDCLGRRTLFLHRGDGFVVFASELGALLSLPFVPRAIDEDAVANYLALNLGRPNQTFYRGIERVPSRTLVTLDQSGVRRRQYWSPDFDAPPPFKKEEDYIERGRELLDQAVTRVTEDTPRIAVLTSGGLDSSAVAATAARLGRAESIDCYCVVPPPDLALDLGPNWYLSERHKVEALARMHPKLNVQFCEEGRLHPFEQNPARLFLKLGAPVLNPWIFAAFGDASDRIAAGRYPVRLGGSLGNFGLSWKGKFSFLSLLRQGKFGTILRDFGTASRQNGRGAFRTFTGDIVAPAVPRWVLRQLNRVRGRNPDDVSSHSCLNPALVHELAASGTWKDDGFDPRFNYSGWEPARFRARYLFDHNQFARDVKAAMPAIFGFETRDPHADRSLIEFLLRVPEPLYRQNGAARSFARKVLADRLPPEILNETRKGAQGVTWFHRLNMQRAELAEDVERLAASRLASRLLDVPRMKRILDDWPKDAQAAELRGYEIRLAFGRGIHVGRFIRWVEGANA